MAWPHLNGVIKVVVTYGFDGKPSINVHFVLMQAPTTPIAASALQAAVDAFFPALDTEWKPFMGDQWTVDGIVATDWSIPNGNQVARVTGLPITGTNISEEVPASVAIVASHRTDKTGRSFRGRTYLPGLTEGNVGGNNVDGLLITGVNDYFDAVTTQLGLVGADLVVYSLYSGGVPRVAPEATLITHRVVNGRVDTQRLRLPR